MFVVRSAQVSPPVLLETLQKKLFNYEQNLRKQAHAKCTHAIFYFGFTKQYLRFV